MQKERKKAGASYQGLGDGAMAKHSYGVTDNLSSSPELGTEEFQKAITGGGNPRKSDPTLENECGSERKWKKIHPSFPN